MRWLDLVPPAATLWHRCGRGPAGYNLRALGSDASSYTGTMGTCRHIRGHRGPGARARPGPGLLPGPCGSSPGSRYSPAYHQHRDHGPGLSRQPHQCGTGAVVCDPVWHRGGCGAPNQETLWALWAFLSHRVGVTSRRGTAGGAEPGKPPADQLRWRPNQSFELLHGVFMLRGRFTVLEYYKVSTERKVSKVFLPPGGHAPRSGNRWGQSA